MDESLLLSDTNSNASSTSYNGTTNIIVNDNDSL